MERSTNFNAVLSISADEKSALKSGEANCLVRNNFIDAERPGMKIYLYHDKRIVGHILPIYGFTHRVTWGGIRSFSDVRIARSKISGFNRSDRSQDSAYLIQVIEVVIYDSPIAPGEVGMPLRGMTPGFCYTEVHCPSCGKVVINSTGHPLAPCSTCSGVRTATLGELSFDDLSFTPDQEERFLNWKEAMKPDCMKYGTWRPKAGDGELDDELDGDVVNMDAGPGAWAA